MDKTIANILSSINNTVVTGANTLEQLTLHHKVLTESMACELIANNVDNELFEADNLNAIGIIIENVDQVSEDDLKKCLDKVITIEQKVEASLMQTLLTGIKQKPNASIVELLMPEKSEEPEEENKKPTIAELLASIFGE